MRISVISEAQPDHDQMFVRVHVVPGYFLATLFVFIPLILTFVTKLVVMKGSIWAAAALCCVAAASLLLTSCDKYGILTNGNAVVSINTASLYEDLGVVDAVAEKLDQGGYVVTDSVLFYDQQGQLVARRGIEATSLHDVNIILRDLPKGTYTVVAWQTTSRGIEPWWSLIEADRLSTARIVQTYPSTSGFMDAVGLYTSTVTIGSEAAVIQAEMEAMGSVVDISVDGLTPECEYEDASLVIWSEAFRVDGFYLNPARSGEDRWVLSDKKIESDLSFGMISSSTPSRTDFTLSHGEKKRVCLYGYDKTTYERKLIISADIALSPGTHPAFYFDLRRISYQPPYTGPAAGFAEWKANRDAGYLVSNPCVDWGTDHQTIRNRVESMMWWRRCNKDLEQDEYGWLRYYSVANKLYEVYYFAEESGKDLFRVFVFTSDETVPLEVAVTHVALQGYEFKGLLPHPGEQQLGKCYVFLSVDEKTEVQILERGAGGWQIIYMPTEPEDLPNIIPAVG